MKTIAQWFADDGGMPPEIAKLARDAMPEWRKMWRSPSLGSAISTGLGLWKETPQGFDFWNACHNAALYGEEWPAIPIAVVTMPRNLAESALGAMEDLLGERSHWKDEPRLNHGEQYAALEKATDELRQILAPRKEEA